MKRKTLILVKLKRYINCELINREMEMKKNLIFFTVVIIFLGFMIVFMFGQEENKSVTVVDVPAVAEMEQDIISVPDVISESDMEDLSPEAAEHD